MLLVNSCATKEHVVLPCYSNEADLKRNNGILQWMKRPNNFPRSK